MQTKAFSLFIFFYLIASALVVNNQRSDSHRGGVGSTAGRSLNIGGNVGADIGGAGTFRQSTPDDDRNGGFDSTIGGSFGIGGNVGTGPGGESGPPSHSNTNHPWMNNPFNP